jgi:type VI protein secretion system component Hcp
MIGDNFMWFPEAGANSIEGETQDVFFATKKAFEVDKFQFKLENKEEQERKGKFQEFEIEKEVDSASMPLYRACSMGTPIDTVMLALRKSGGNDLIYLQFIFRGVKITGITWSGGQGTESATEKMTFSFKAMGAQYYAQKVDGSFDPRNNRKEKVLGWSWTSATQDGKPGAPSMDIGLKSTCPPFLPPHV